MRCGYNNKVVNANAKVEVIIAANTAPTTSWALFKAYNTIKSFSPHLFHSLEETEAEEG